MSSLWLWAALVFYSLGFAFALLTVVQQRRTWFRLAMSGIGIGFIFHFVSLAERGISAGHFPATNISEATSLFALLVTAGFLLAYRRYHMTAFSVFAFPVLMILTLAAAASQRPSPAVEPILKTAWVPLHVSFTMIGYTALLLACLTGVMYLIQERELKRKKPHAFYYRLPPLETVDRLGSQTLTIGFPFITVGMSIGLLGAMASWETGWVQDPKVAISLLLWVVYLLLILSRVRAGWRGHRAALFAIFGLVMALVSWSANYLSTHHSFLGH